MTWNRFSCSPWASWQTPATRSRHKTWARWLIEQFSFLNSIWIRGPCQPVRPDFPHPIWLAPTTPPPVTWASSLPLKLAPRLPSFLGRVHLPLRLCPYRALVRPLTPSYPLGLRWPSMHPPVTLPSVTRLTFLVARGRSCLHLATCSWAVLQMLGNAL